MSTSLFFGGSVVAAVIGGMIALFAPCCISFMLPAYFASAFQNRSRLVLMSFLFTAGVATVILPIALGASILRQIFTEDHPVIYTIGGILLLGLAVYTLLGREIQLPMPGRSANGNPVGPLSVYTLGIFSGITSSCCAPVLAGVIALAGVAPSFFIALGLGLAYVFGMVSPLFLISLLWERADWKSNGLFRQRTVRVRLGSRSYPLTVTGLATGIFLAVLGGALVWIGLTTRSMAALTGWQAQLTFQLQHIGQVLTKALIWLPNWLVVVALIAVVASLAYYAWDQWTDDQGNTEPASTAQGVTYVSDLGTFPEAQSATIPTISTAIASKRAIATTRGIAGTATTCCIGSTSATASRTRNQAILPSPTRPAMPKSPADYRPLGRRRDHRAGAHLRAQHG